MTLQDLLNRIRTQQDTFSAAQQLVAAFVLDNYHQIPFLSITALSESIGVSDNTVVKFCNRLGFDRFAEFKKFVSDYVSQYSAPELVMSRKLSDSSDDSVFSRCMEEDIYAIQNTLSDPSNQENLGVLVHMMENAQHIYVSAARSSASMASLLVTELRYLNYKVYECNVGSGDYLDRLSMIEPDDLFIALTFPRYTAEVVNGIKNVRASGTPVVLITDTGLSPAHPYCDLAFHCTVSSGYYFPCLSGCLSLISVICRTAGAARKQHISGHISQLESKLIEQGVFL